MASKRWLTPGEIGGILQLLVDGKAPKEIVYLKKVALVTVYALKNKYLTKYHRRNDVPIVDPRERARENHFKRAMEKRALNRSVKAKD